MNFILISAGLKSLLSSFRGASKMRTRNPYSRSWLWIPGLRLTAHPGMTEQVGAATP
jgi:hypothetical protein